MNTIKLYLSVMLVGFGLSACEYSEPNVYQPSVYFQKFIGGAFGEELVESALLDDGSIIMLGNREEGTNNQSNIYLAKTDNNGDLVWEKELGVGQNTVATDLLIMPNNELLVLATLKNTAGDSDFGLLKLSTEGSIVDSISLGNANRMEEANQIALKNSGDGFIVGGVILENGQIVDNLFYDINTDGSVINWEVSYGNLITPGELVGIRHLTDGNILWVGNVNNSNTVDSDIITAVIRNNGIIEEVAYYGQNNGKNDIARSMVDYGDNWMIAGSTDNQDFNVRNGLAVELAYNGTIEILRSFTNQTERPSEFNHFAISSVRQIFAVGSLESSPENTDLYLSSWTATENLVFERLYGGDENDVAQAIHLSEGYLTMIGASTVATNVSLVLIRTDENGYLLGDE